MNDEPLDILMQEASKPPEFPAATRDQVERTWQAIEGQLEERLADAETIRDGEETAPSGWLAALFPTAPSWSLQFAQVAAILVVGFGAAWFAAGRGWLPGTGAAGGGGSEIGSVGGEAPGDVGPDRSWLAVNDYGSRLEALLLGVARGATSGNGEVGPAAREVSRELLQDNRFYQRVARRNGDADLAGLLSRIEIILLAVATAPEGQEQEAVEALREFIGESDLLDELRQVRATVPKTPSKRSTTTGS